MAAAALPDASPVLGLEISGHFAASVPAMPSTTAHPTLQPRSSRSRAMKASMKSAIRDALLKHIWPPLDAGKLRPHIHAQFPLSQAADAHRLMESRLHIGKIVLEVDTTTR
jgi:NADPH:quinone reductase-like Zn-dependent oxidoreductase